MTLRPFGLIVAFFLPVSSVAAAPIVGTLASEKLAGTKSNDVLVGDYYAPADPGGYARDMYVNCNPGNSMSGQKLLAMNDSFLERRGDDLVIGDFYVPSAGELYIGAVSGVGSSIYGDNGDGNTAECFNDVRKLGSQKIQNDKTFVGDVYADFSTLEISVTASAGGVGLGNNSIIFSESLLTNSGAGGNNNQVFAFNDKSNSNGKVTGAQILVGDVYLTGPTSEIGLAASAGSGGMGTAVGGHSNTVLAFKDTIRGGQGSDLIVGDYARQGPKDELELVVAAGAGGGSWNDLGALGGNDNTTDGFSDDLFGRAGNDTIIGDAFSAGGTEQEEFVFTVLAGKSWSNAAASAGNFVAAFNDRIVGGDGHDTIVGDGWNENATHEIKVSIYSASGNTVNAFRDKLHGNKGKDTIHGDFKFDVDVCEIDQFEIHGVSSGTALLFADSIYGDNNDDVIHGGFGADTMSGGKGADTFLFYQPDLTDLGAGMPVDVITDFGVGNDVIDLSPIFSQSCLGVDATDINDYLRVNGAVIEIDVSGNGSTFLPMISVPGLNWNDVDTMINNQVLKI